MSKRRNTKQKGWSDGRIILGIPDRELGARIVAIIVGGLLPCRIECADCQDPDGGLVFHWHDDAYEKLGAIMRKGPQ